MMRVLLVDDHAIVRQSLARLLGWEADIEIVGEVGDAKLGVEMTRALHPDIVLMDLHMPVMDGVEATRRIHAEQPEVQVIGLSVFQEDERIKPMLEAGAVAYVSKTESTEGLLARTRSCYRRIGRSENPQLEMALK